MRTLYLECVMGAAGDMLAAALLDLLDEGERADFVNDMNALGLPDTTVQAKAAVSCGIRGLHWEVSVGGEHEVSEDVEPGAHDHDHSHGCDHDHSHGCAHDHSHGCDHDHSHSCDHDHSHAHDHPHDHGHHHTHERNHDHRGLGSIAALIDSLPVSAGVRDDAKAVYALLAEAESHAHGREVDQVHFHEVGSLDAVADIVGVCMLVERLDPDVVFASPVQVGEGFVWCAHGMLPVPAPATAYLLRGIPIKAGAVRAELCTPTGAALLRHFVQSFGTLPDITTERVGYGLGRKQFGALNAVRSYIGESTEQERGANSPNGTITELHCTVDDMTGETIGYATETLMHSGALDVSVEPVQMKKNRPGLIISCLCATAQADDMAALLLRHTSTYGVRRYDCIKYMLDRAFETVQTAYGPISVKHGSGYGVVRVKPEYAECADAAMRAGVPIETVMRAAMNAVDALAAQER